MALKVVWSKRASTRFDQIIDYLQEEWGNQSVKIFVRKVFELADTLAEYPELGSVENAEKGIRGFTIVKQINLFYKVTDDTIILLHFFDNRKHPSKKRL
jgi:plasmid stabilization system protein ParE